MTIVERCRKYNACVIYLVHEEDNEVETEEILAVEAGMTRRSGLSVGTALVTMEQLYEVTMPRNTIATVTISDRGKISPPVGHQPVMTLFVCQALGTAVCCRTCSTMTWHH